MTLTLAEAVTLIELDADCATAKAYVYAISRARLARGLYLTLTGSKSEAQRILISTLQGTLDQL